MRLCAQLRIPCQVPLKRKHFEGFMNWKGSVENIISSYETRGKVLSAIPIEKAPHILGLEWHITPKADHAHSALRQTASWTLQSRLVPGPSPIASAWPEPAGLQEYIIYIYARVLNCHGDLIKKVTLLITNEHCALKADIILILFSWIIYSIHG